MNKKILYKRHTYWKANKKIAFFKVFPIALCILGLIVSYGCKRKIPDNPYDAGNEGKIQPLPTGTFSISQASNNTTSLIVKTANTVGEIRIGFVSASNYSYSISGYDIEDDDKNPNNRITTNDTKYINDILTIEESGLKKIRDGLDSSTNFASKNIAVKFGFTATDTNLANSETSAVVIVTLTHAQTFANDGDKNTFIGTVLKKGSGLEAITNKEESGKTTTEGYSYKFTNGTITIETTPPLFTFTIKNAIGEGTNESPVSKSLLKKFVDSTLKASVEAGDSPIPEISKSVFSKAEDGKDKKSYSLTYKVTWQDIYDLSETEITIKFESQNEGGFTDDTSTPTTPETARSRRFF